MAAIGVFDMFNMEEFEPEEADPDLFRRRRSGSIEVRTARFTHVLCISRRGKETSS